MREIKFQIYWVAGHEMLYDTNNDLEFRDKENYWITDLSDAINHPESYKVRQYTGLKDKNGVEIYEGDIISCTQQRFSTNGIVTMHHGMWNWQYKKGAVSLLYEANKKWEGTVIGNIYENPELAK